MRPDPAGRSAVSGLYALGRPYADVGGPCQRPGGGGGKAHPCPSVRRGICKASGHGMRPGGETRLPRGYGRPVQDPQAGAGRPGGERVHRQHGRRPDRYRRPAVGGGPGEKDRRHRSGGGLDHAQAPGGLFESRGALGHPVCKRRDPAGGSHGYPAGRHHPFQGTAGSGPHGV